MRNDNQDLLIYDRTWGALVTYQGLNDVNADFGNAWNNDKVSLPYTCCIYDIFGQ